MSLKGVGGKLRRARAHKLKQALLASYISIASNFSHWHIHYKLLRQLTGSMSGSLAVNVQPGILGPLDSA